MSNDLHDFARNASENPGVYLFKDEGGAVIYVGKAKNLKNRLTSYFANQLMPKTAQMVASAKSLKTIKVNSEFEALLLEANLIRRYQPKYNVALKDDKSPLYIGITREKYPKIIALRKNEIASSKLKVKYWFGPYLSGYAVKGILRRIRKVFPYSTHEAWGRVCIYKQLGLCNPCPSEIENEMDPELKINLRRKYLRNVRGVKNILSGKLGNVGEELRKEIKEYSRNEQFEEAAEVKKQLGFFERLTFRPDFEIEEYLENPNLLTDIRGKESQNLLEILRKSGVENLPGKLSRIECFDIAHLAGVKPTASMVTFVDGEADKNYYRHFKIYQKKPRSDVDSMREVISRRIKHLEDWGRPDLIIIDGGKPQLSKVHDLLEKESIPFIGLAKRFETIVVFESGGFKEVRAYGEALNLLQRIRDEAHRFARRLHHKQIKDTIK